jgi:hypothetical protein
MVDWTAIVGALTTLAGGLGGYWLAGRNEEARDKRAAAREVQARREALGERLEEDRHNFQRDTLLELQEELQRITENVIQIMTRDTKTIKESGEIQLGGSLSDENKRIAVSIQRLKNRVLDDELRQAVRDYGGLCSTYGLGEHALPFPEGKVPDARRVYALEQLDEGAKRVAFAYAKVTDMLGAQLRRELDRRYLISAPPEPSS